MKWYRAKQKDRRRRNIKGVLFIFLGVFLGLSLFSYSPEDPSFNSFGINLKVINYCGYVGAFLGDLFYQLFGMMSWGFVLGSFVLAGRYFMETRARASFISNVSLFFIFLASLSCLTQLYFKSYLFYEGKVRVGGALGTMLLRGFEPLFHPIGTTVLLWAVLILSLVFYGQLAFLKWIHLFFQNGIRKVFSLSYFLFKQLPKLKAWSFFLLKKSASFLFLMKNFVSSVFAKKSDKELKSNKEIEMSKQPEPSLKENATAKEFSFNSKSKEQELFFPNEEHEEEEKPKHSPARPDFKSFPSLDFLTDPPAQQKTMGIGQAELLSKKLVSKLLQFSIEGKVTAIKPGPAVTLFEFKPNDNVKVSRIKEMGNDISLALSSESVRIIAPIPGRDVVGIEVSNSARQMVYLKTLVEHPRFNQVKIPLVLGRRADNQICIEDLAKLPHLLVAGTTGSGKSVFVINFIVGLLYRHTPDNLRFLLVDPKQVDLSVFKDVPHLLAPPVTSTQKTVQLLRWVCIEMEKRYRSLAAFGVRDISSFNQMVGQLSSREKKQHEENQKNQSYYYEKLPIICLVVEEFGDLMMDSQIRKPIETYVVKLAQKARASGIHLVLAMQSPRKDVITGLIKTNIPGRISFKVSSSTDSRVILDEGGAERLLSQGDMLFLQPGTSKPLRFHGPYISEKEVSRVVDFWKNEGEPEYKDIFSEELDKKHSSAQQLEDEKDAMYEEIKNFIRTQKFVSASYLQRKFRIGYPRAARLIEILHEEGKIGPPQGSKPREVLSHE